MNKICRTFSVLPNSSFSVRSLFLFHLASRAFASETRSERLNIKRAQSLGHSSAKLAQGTSSELENETRGEREREGGEMSVARGISERLENETERSREVRDREAKQGVLDGGKREEGRERER